MKSLRDSITRENSRRLRITPCGGSAEKNFPYGNSDRVIRLIGNKPAKNRAIETEYVKGAKQKK